MAELKNYDVVANGMTTTVRLSDADAKRRGLTQTTKAAPKSAPVSSKTVAGK